MPYNTNGTLLVREFRGSSKSNILRTTKRTMQSWNSQRYIFGGPIPVGFALNDDRIINGNKIDTRYVDELLERIKTISVSERMSYQKIIY